MHKPKILTDWEFPDTIRVPDGYDLKSIPDMTRDNFITLVREYNNLAGVIDMLCEKHGIVFDE